MQVKQIGIVGLGLMGGSLGLALKNISSSYQIIGFDHDKVHEKEALSLHLVDTLATSIEEIYYCDVIFLTIPVDSIITFSQHVHISSDYTTIIDLGSTKEKISQAIPSQIRSHFVTAHPMTGTEKFGPSAAIKDLYQDKVVVLCDMEKSGTHQQQVAKKIFASMGMKLVYMDASEHDRHAAYISHMPHALSYALANSVMRQEAKESILALAGGGFKDMSRIAKSSPNMWEDIFRQNKENLLEAIYTFESELKKCRKMVENDEWKTLNTWMKEANTLHDIL